MHRQQIRERGEERKKRKRKSRFPPFPSLPNPTLSVQTGVPSYLQKWQNTTLPPPPCPQTDASDHAISGTVLSCYFRGWSCGGGGRGRGGGGRGGAEREWERAVRRRGALTHLYPPPPLTPSYHAVLLPGYFYYSLPPSSTTSLFSPPFLPTYLLPPLPPSTHLPMRNFHYDTPIKMNSKPLPPPPHPSQTFPIPPSVPIMLL